MDSFHWKVHDVRFVGIRVCNWLMVTIGGRLLCFHDGTRVLYGLYLPFHCRAVDWPSFNVDIQLCSKIRGSTQSVERTDFQAKQTNKQKRTISTILLKSCQNSVRIGKGVQNVIGKNIRWVNLSAAIQICQKKTLFVVSQRKLVSNRTTDLHQIIFQSLLKLPVKRIPCSNKPLVMELWA